MNETEEAEIRIRAAYASWQCEPSLDGSYIPMTDEEANDEFDAWLTEHDREVAERAWDEGYTEGAVSGILDTWESHNPYRKDAS